MNTDRFSIEARNGRFVVIDGRNGVVANYFATREEAEAAIAAYVPPARRTPSRRAWDRGQSYGVNGQIWDEDI